MANSAESPQTEWFQDYDDTGEDDLQIDEYDLTASPNDFNVLTIFSFIESGAVKIPGFQRNYVWDPVRASKLIESLILGLPVPQIFLYEESRNSFLLVDGQQRLMTIYYFIKQRFPRKEKRVEFEAFLLNTIKYRMRYCLMMSTSLILTLTCQKDYPTIPISSRV